MNKFILTCFDAAYIGSPMGMVKMPKIFSKSFPTVEAAKAYAKIWQTSKGIEWPVWTEWNIHTTGIISCDARVYFWKIENA